MADAVVLEVARRHTRAVAFSPDGTHLAVGSQQGTLQVYRTDDWHLEHDLQGHGASVNGITWHNGGHELLTWASDKTVRRWSLDTGTPQWTRFGYTTASAAPDWHEFLAIKDSHAHADVLTPGTGHVRDALVTGVGKITNVWHLAATNRWACSVDPHDVHVYQRNGTPCGVMDGHTWRCTDLAQSGDGTVLVTADDNGNLTRWDPHTLQVLEQIDPHQDIGARTHIALDPTGRLLATAGPGGVDLLALDGTVLATWPVDLKGLYGIDIHPDGTLVANAAADGNVRVWRVPEKALV